MRQHGGEALRQCATEYVKNDNKRSVFMEFKTCNECGRVFQYMGIGEMLCPVCKKQDEIDFDNVKDYLVSHPGALGEEVFEATKVPVTKIITWLREERLLVPNAKGIGLKCESCGEVINSGKLCQNCKRNLAMGYKEAPSHKSVAENGSDTFNKTSAGGMRFIRRK